MLKKAVLLVISLTLFNSIGCKDPTDRTASKSTVANEEQRRPNILFAIMDDATYMHMGAYGCTWVNTPNFDRVAANGLLFNRAYANNAKCAPSRSNILTGRNSWQLEEAANHWPYFPQKFKVFTEALDQHGYKVGYTGKGWAPGVAKNADGGKRELLIEAYQKIKTTPPTEFISKIDYAANFNVFLKKREKTKKPFFFWYGGIEPHRQYEYRSGIEKGGKHVWQIPNGDLYNFWPANDSIKVDLLDYAFEIEYFDEQLGKMLQMLEDSGELDNTIVVVTADNGMPFPRIKGQEYEYSNHLPLAIMWADGIEHPGRKIEDYISFIDFAPTFLEVAEIEQDETGMEPITGKSFAPFFGSPKTSLAKKQDNYVLIGKERHDIGRPHDRGYPIRGIVKDDMLYLHNFKTDRWPVGNPETGYTNTDGGATKTVVLNTVHDRQMARYWQWNFGKRPQDELYDISKDPDCLENLAFTEGYEPMTEQLREELYAKLKKQKDPRMFGKGDLFDDYSYADPSGVDFYERYRHRDSTLTWGWINDSDFQDLSGVDYIDKKIKD